MTTNTVTARTLLDLQMSASPYSLLLCGSCSLFTKSAVINRALLNPAICLLIQAKKKAPKGGWDLFWNSSGYYWHVVVNTSLQYHMDLKISTFCFACDAGANILHLMPNGQTLECELSAKWCVWNVYYRNITHLQYTFLLSLEVKELSSITSETVFLSLQCSRSNVRALCWTVQVKVTACSTH